MNNGIVLGVVFLFVGMSFTSISGNQINNQSIKSSGRGNILYVGGSGPGNYSRIQDAVDNASDGDTVFVYNGTYRENVVIDKSINLYGECKDNTFIPGYMGKYPVIINADWVNFSGFNTKGSYKCVKINSNNSTIRENNFLYYWDIGIEINSDYNTITNNNIQGDGNGIEINSDYNTITNNNISEFYAFGIYLSDSSIGNYILGNNISAPYYGYEEYGIFLDSSSNNTIIRNTISENLVGIELKNSNNNTILSNSIISNNGVGVSFYFSKNNYVRDNNFFKNMHDFGLSYSNNNTIKENVFKDTICCSCISITYSDFNIVTDNNINLRHGTGIGFYSSNHSMIVNNTISNGSGISLGASSNYNIFINNYLYNCGFCLSDSYINNFYNNTINDKPLLYLVNESDTVINIDAGQIIMLNCNNITIRNQTLSNTGIGIKLWSSNNCSIFNNNFTKNGNCISLERSSNTFIFNNHFTDNGFGVELEDSSYNLIMDNNFHNGDHYGITIESQSNNNIIKGNNLWNYRSNGISIRSSDNNSILCNFISKSSYGIIIDESCKNNVTGNYITDNGEGIRLTSSSKYNIVSENNVLNNEDGITFYSDDVDNNYIYHNNFINNTRNAYIHTNSISRSKWDDGYPSGGNYWDDYDGVDDFSGPNQDIPGSDGIGDTPYDIPSFLKNEDRYPLMEPWNQKPHKPTISGPKNGKPWTIYTFTAVASDPEGGNVSYFFDWGDLSNSGWTEFVPSGTAVNRSHSWMFKGNYIIKVKAKDEFGKESDWGTLVVTIPRNKATSNILFQGLKYNSQGYNRYYFYDGGI